MHSADGGRILTGSTPYEQSVPDAQLVSIMSGNPKALDAINALFEAASEEHSRPLPATHTASAVQRRVLELAEALSSPTRP